MEPVSEPELTLHDPADLLAGYLDYYRDGVVRKFSGLSDQDARRSFVPSGWTPLGLLKHLAYMERRWMRWGFAGERVTEPWGDQKLKDGEWYVEPGETVDDVMAFFREQCSRSRAIAASAKLDDHAAVGGRFKSAAETPTLAWVLFHVLQEYARHLGHLDIVRELADGVIGE
ncbi:DinB family protein [Actinocrispum wychmicini]|uniref:DinB family protein n=1 Tax=Actinocrispum wychmicini TaxID=1213861 RepID=UPI001A9D5D01|nr:DinB family protein [Actinocrispum wychmicini]